MAATVVGTRENVVVSSSDPPAAPSARWWVPACWYMGMLVVVVLTGWLTLWATTPSLSYVVRFPGDGALGGLSRYDGGWYELISRFGYDRHRPGAQSPVAFFPGYPLAMRLVGGIVGNNALAGILVTACSGLGVAVLFGAWCRERLGRPAARVSALALLLYPYGFYLYGVMYADAMFLCSSLLAFWAVERDRPLWAGAAGAVATLTRPVGIAVALGLAVRLMERRGVLAGRGRFGLPSRVAWNRIRAADAWVMTSLGGLAAYMGYLWFRFGDPLLFSSVQEHWGQSPGPRTWLKVAFYHQLRLHPDRFFTWGLVIQATLALLALVTVPLVGRRFGWGYAVHVGVVLLIPLVGTKNFHGIGRYGLAAFPVFAIVGSYLTNCGVVARRVVLGLEGFLLVAGSAAFAHGVYLS